MQLDLIHKNKSYFCPVSLGKYIGMGLIGLMVVSLVAATVLNMYYSSPVLLGLYAIPVIIFTLFIANAYLVTAFSMGVSAMWFYFSEVSWLPLIGLAILLLIVLLLRRVVTVSRTNFRQKTEYEELFMNTMVSFSKSIDARDPYTAFHSRNVAGYAKKIAEEMGLPKREVEAVHLAGLIHDIGKIGTPEHILHKESRLTDEEYEIMKKHAEDGYQIIKNIKRLVEMGVTEMVRHHHERMDGRGYPMGLKGQDIPLGARILAACDAFDAMTTNRSYRKKLSMETAAEELRRHSGTQFDDKVAEAFLKVLKRDGLLEKDTAPAAIGTVAMLKS